MFDTENIIAGILKPHFFKQFLPIVPVRKIRLKSNESFLFSSTNMLKKL